MLYLKIVIITLFFIGSLQAKVTPNGQIEVIKKDEKANYDGYVVDNQLMNHMITVSEEKEVLEEQNDAMEDVAKLKEIEHQDSKNQIDAYKVELQKEKASKWVIVPVAIILGFLTGGAAVMLLHLAI